MTTFLRILFWVAINSRLYYLWSKFYQSTFERWAKNVVLPVYGSLLELEADLSKMKWIADGFWELGDAIGSPQATYVKYLKESKLAKDCDEFAIYAVDRIEEMKSRGLLSSIRSVGILSVPWHGPKGTGGHNVCAISYIDEDTEKWAYVGNWYHGQTQWGFASLTAVASEIVGNNVSLGYGFANNKLKLLKYKWDAKS